MELADCGAACLAIVLEHLGRPVSLDEVRDITGSGREGVSALALVDAARWFGLRARGVRAEVEDLRDLPAGTLLFWDMSHFVVLERAGRRHVDLIDPAVGRRRVPLDAVGRSFTGVALLVEPGDAFQPGGRRSWNLRRHIEPILRHRSVLARVLTTSLLLRVFALGLPLLTGALVDRVVPRHDHSLLTVITASLGVMVGFNFLSTWLRGRLLLELRTYADEATTVGFLEHLVALPYTFHLRRSAGDLLTRLRSNSAVREILTTGALSALLDGAFVTLYLVLLVALSPVLAVVAVAFAVAQVTVLLAVRRRTHHLMSESLQAEAHTQGYAFQILSGMGTLKASGTEDRAVEAFANLFSDELSATVRRGALSALVDALTGALRLAAPMAVLVVGGELVLSGRLTLGTALAVNALAAGFLEPLSTLVTTGLSAQLLGSYLERLADVLDAPREQQGLDVRPPPALQGHIRADGVSFRYSQSGPLVVEEVSLDIGVGQTVGLVGRSGSGKTTLAHLLVGLYQPATGTVLHDGLDLATLDLRLVRRQLGVVTQDPYLFAVSIRDNIAFARPGLALEEVQQAASLAAIAADIDALPLGYDTVLADGGQSLSGGQRQRLALARALAGQPRVLLLDEATSHLDSVTEAAVYDALRTLPCTKIVVAHRLSTVASADLILVMEAGRIVEQGRHHDLLDRGGVYARLVDAQVGPRQRPRDDRGL